MVTRVKQIRDNIHAYNVCRLLHEFYKSPRCGKVYNLGGGRENSISVLGTIDKAQQGIERKLEWTYVDENRNGDHICCISDLSKIKKHFPNWSIPRSLDDIFDGTALVLKK